MKRVILSIILILVPVLSHAQNVRADLAKVISSFAADKFYFNSFQSNNAFTLVSDGMEMTDHGYRTVYSTTLSANGTVVSKDDFGRVVKSTVYLFGPRANVELMEIYTETFVLGDVINVESYLQKMIPVQKMLYVDNRDMSSGYKMMYHANNGLYIGYSEDSGNHSGSLIIYVSSDMSVVEAMLAIQ